ncbi:MAG TPA: hypothetical protein VKS01_04220, partial [Bryobacteraceae bacterium]|nr:hypothetical protein [Bryobacteraceae bacterium]
WIRDHSPQQILAQMPAEFRVGDSAAEIEAIKMAKPMYSIDGTISRSGAEAVIKVRAAHVDLSKTYTNDFVK